MVCVVVALVEDVFPDLEEMLDVQVRAPTPSSFVRDETLVELACVSWLVGVCVRRPKSSRGVEWKVSLREIFRGLTSASLNPEHLIGAFPSCPDAVRGTTMFNLHAIFEYDWVLPHVDSVT